MLTTEKIHLGANMKYQGSKIQHKVTECTAAFDKTSYLPSSSPSVSLRRKIWLKLFEIAVL